MYPKIVHLCTFASGGAGKAAYRLHNGLCGVGMDSTFLTLSKGIPDPTVKVIHGSTISQEPGYARELGIICNGWQRISNEYPYRPRGLEMFSGADSPVDLMELEEIRSADIVHLHWVAGLVDYDRLKFAVEGKKIVWTLHDMNPFTGGCHYAGDCLKYGASCGACPQLGSYDDNDLSRRIWEKKCQGLHGLDITVVTPSRWLSLCASRSTIFRDCRVVCIPYGLPTQVFRPHDRREIREVMGISPDAKVILFGAENLGNNRKGFEYLLEALRRYRTQGDREIVLVTFGDLDPSITIDSPYPVIPCGSIGDEQNLAYIYSMADLMVIPSLEDNLPNTVLEAMACGTPVVGFAIGGIPDMVEHKRTGYLAAAGSVDELVAGIDWGLFNSHGSDLSNNCRRKVEALYSLATQAARYQILYRSLIGINRTPDR